MKLRTLRFQKKPKTNQKKQNRQKNPYTRNHNSNPRLLKKKKDKGKTGEGDANRGEGTIVGRRTDVSTARLYVRRQLDLFSLLGFVDFVGFVGFLRGGLETAGVGRGHSFPDSLRVTDLVR